MKLNEISVINASLPVHGIARLRIVHGSILPGVTKGGAQASCAIVGERATDVMRGQQGI